MELSDDDASLLAKPAPRMQPFAWTFFETLPKGRRSGPRTLIALGTIETLGDCGPRLDTLVVDVGDTTRERRPVMRGAGRVVRPGWVKITTGDVIINRPDLRGLGLGYRALNASIRWAQLHHPDAAVEPITLVRTVARTETEWAHEFEKLTSFYGRFGFRWLTPPLEAGLSMFPSEPIMVSGLKTVDEATLPLIRRVDMPPSLTNILKRLHDGADDREKIKVLSIALRDRRERWQMVGYRLNLIGWTAAFGLGWLAAKSM